MRTLLAKIGFVWSSWKRSIGITEYRNNGVTEYRNNRNLFFCSSILLFFLLVSLPTTTQASLYQDILEIERTSLMLDGTEDALTEYIPKIIELEEELTEDEVGTITEDNRHETNKLCNERGESRGGCQSISLSTKALAEREERVRTLGRDLQLITSGYELPISDHPGRMMAIIARLPSINRIWEATNDNYISPILQRKISAGGIPPEVDPLLSQLHSALRSIDNGDDASPELLTAVVWRYKYGVKEIERLESACPGNLKPNNTELQYLSHRWCNIENLLSQILNAVPEPDSIRFDEYIIYPSRLLRDIGVIVWVRRGRDDKVDVGLEWETPIEPVLPSLRCNETAGAPQTRECFEGALLGGLFPPDPTEPGDGEKLCSGTFASRGYLCRPLENLHCPALPEEEEEEESPDADDDADDDDEEEEEEPEDLENYLVLRSCQPEATAQYDLWRSESGPNACEIGGWRDSPTLIDEEEVEDTTARDDDIDAPYDCGNCSIDLYCDGGGEDDQNCGDSFAITFPKEDSGVIPICLPSTSQTPVTYLLIHELVHAQQLCNNPGGSMPNNGPEQCCSMERPAYQVHCNAMAEDGIFEGTDITIELCTNVLTNKSCGDEFFGGDDDEEPDPAAPGTCTEHYSQGFIDEVAEKIIEAANKNPANVAEGCSDVIENIDPRAEMIISSLPKICSAECEAKYDNTIGNNACYIAQCTEQSVETRRILPGRMSFLSQGQSFPWDSEGEPNPLIGSLLPIPPSPSTHFEAYNPALLARDLDLTLCQLNGLPLQSPPSNCQFEATRQLRLPSAEQITTAAGVLSQADEQLAAENSLRAMAPSLGTRIGTNLYQEYFGRQGRALSELVGSANELIGGIAGIEFPRDMCPRVEP